MHFISQPIPVRIETPRLTLRCYQPGDGAMYYRVGLKNRQHLIPFESGNALLSLNDEIQSEEVIADLINDWQTGNCYFLGAFDKINADFVAQVYVGHANRDVKEFDLGYIVDCDHEGHGYVTEAVKAVLGWIFDHLEANRVRIECSDANLRSARVAERCGFTLEGHTRQDQHAPDGSLCGRLFYGLLCSEYHNDRLHPQT
jgi:RimJ/RimL family protein N-acetyltransferase